MIVFCVFGVVELMVVDDEKIVIFVIAASRAGRSSAAFIFLFYVVEVYCGGCVFIVYGIIFLGF